MVPDTINNYNYKITITVISNNYEIQIHNLKKNKNKSTFMRQW